MASNNKLKSVVVKPPVHPLSRPSQRPASHDQASHDQASHAQTSRSASPPSKTISFGDLVNPDWPKEKRLMYKLQYFGHFDVDDEDEWTQAEVDAEWVRQQTINMGRAPVTERSQAFILNPNFKPPSPPKEESDEEEYRLPFEYKPDPTRTIDWDAIRAQPYQRSEDSAAYKAAVLNSKKRKSEEDLEEDVEAIKSKFKALKSIVGFCLIST
jgi:hypothetical protein